MRRTYLSYFCIIPHCSQDFPSFGFSLGVSIADYLLPVLDHGTNDIREFETVPKSTTNPLFVSVAEWNDADLDIIRSHQHDQIRTAF